jgi:hypothetical protein
MNEMDELARFRAQAPDRGTARAEEIFRAALTEELSSERKLVSRHRKRSRRLRPAWRLAIAAPVALGLAVGVAVAVQPSGSKPPTALPSRTQRSALPSSSQPQPVTTATLLADRAAAAALADPAVPAGQWIYEQTEHNLPAGLRHLPRGHNPMVQDGWMTADGTMSYGDAGISGNPIYPYSKLASLPRDPAKLDAYFVSLDPDKSDNRSLVAFSQIESMLFGMVLPPSLEAEMYHALALIHNVQVKEHVRDIAGRAGVAFVLPPTKQSEQLEIILDASDYHLLARASFLNPGNPSSGVETAILKEYPVAEPGSTQPSTVPPSAAELAAERIFFYEEYQYAPPKINHVAPGQWLYRDLRTGGKDQEIWATADDSAQAQYVNGTLTVCQRTDSCAASEQWLMPTGPGYSLIYPPDRAAPSALPPLPRPLLATLNTYRTGCADVAADCNAVNVAANVLTGYGNYPYLDSSWFLALADVPGVSVKHVTDAAGNQDVAFTFPSQDGVTAILVNATLLKAGTIQYEGYVRDGQQTLVLNQALVSGPGVRP